MKVSTGQFNESYLPILDGTSITVKNYAYWLNKKYGKTLVVTPKVPEFEDHESFDVIRYKSVSMPKRPPYRLGLPKFDRNLKELLKNQYFDIVHAHSPFSSGKIALKLAKERNIPIVASFNNKYYIDLKGFFKSDIIAKHFLKKIINFYNQVDKVYTVNYKTIDTLREYGYKGKVDVIGNGTDFIWDKDTTNDIDYINHLYGIDGNMHVLLFVGKHIWPKNIKLIIESLVNLCKLKQQFKMFFVGDGYAREDMIKLVEDNNLQKYVVFVGQVLDREQLKKYYLRANLFLLPSTYDTSGIVVKEAASLRCPSLVLKDTSASELIKDNYNGYLSENNSLSYAQRIIAALNDQNKEQVGINAQQTLVVNYEKIIDEVFTRYCEIIKIKRQY